MNTFKVEDLALFHTMKKICVISWETAVTKSILQCQYNSSHEATLVNTLIILTVSCARTNLFSHTTIEIEELALSKT